MHNLFSTNRNKLAKTSGERVNTQSFCGKAHGWNSINNSDSNRIINNPVALALNQTTHRQVASWKLNIKRKEMLFPSFSWCKMCFRHHACVTFYANHSSQYFTFRFWLSHINIRYEMHWYFRVKHISICYRFCLLWHHFNEFLHIECHSRIFCNDLISNCEHLHIINDLRHNFFRCFSKFFSA